MNERGEKVNLGGSRPPGGESAPKPAAKRKPKAATGGGGGGSSAPQSTPTPEPIKLTGEEKKLHGSLVRFHAMIGMGVQQVGRARRDPNMAVAGVNIVAMASDTADSWMELAQQNPAVKKALSGFVQGGAIAGVAGCYVAMALPIVVATGQPQLAPLATMFLHDDARAAAPGIIAEMQAQQNGTPQ